MALPRLNGAIFRQGPITPFPDRWHGKLNWELHGTLTTGTTTGQIGTPFSIQLNDLYNTNAHQPYGYDTLRTIYQNSRVTHADVYIELSCGRESTDSMGVLVGVFPNSSNLPASSDSINEWAEVPGMLSRVLTPAGNASVFTFQQKVPIAAIEGLNPAQMEASPNYAQFSNTSVPYGPELTISVCNLTGSSANKCYYRVKIVFTCDFWQRTTLPQS